MDVNVKEEKKQFWKCSNILIVCALIVCFCLCLNSQKGNELTYVASSRSTDVGIFSNVYDGVEVRQVFTRPMEQISAISIDIPTYGRTAVSGELQIKVYNEGKLVGEKSVKGQDVFDGYSVRVDLFERQGKIGDQIEINITCTTTTEEPIALWIYYGESELNSHMILNDGEAVQGVTAMKIIYDNCNLSRIWWFFVAISLVALVVMLQDKIDWRKYITLPNMCYAFLFLFAFFVFNMRGGVFSYSQIYAEDAVYLNRIINEGFWESCFSTRSGLGGDFLNLGSYIMLGIAWIVNRLIYGYNLVHLPMMIGLVSSVFYGLVATYAYKVLKKGNHILGIFAFFITVFIPVGVGTPEIFGRVLNTVFLFPFLAIILLIDLWDGRFSATIKQYVKQLLVLICGLSFPISFGALGVYLFFGIVDSIKMKRIKEFLLSNILLLISLFVGMLLLPTMIGSKGASKDFEPKPEAFTEFIFARHMLYPFVYLFYDKLNDGVVLFISALMFVIIIMAIYFEKRDCGKFDKYSLISVMSLLCIAASVVMRISMSQLFNSYLSTYPDRYYYACNIIFAVLIIYGICIINKHFNGKWNSLFRGIAILLVVALMANKELMFKKGRDEYLIRGFIEKNSWEECLNSAYSEGLVSNGRYIVNVAPFETTLMECPVVYIWTSVNIEN